MWHLRYLAVLTRWDFLGGSPIRMQNAALSSCGVSAWQWSADGAMYGYLPLAGCYRYQAQADMYIDPQSTLGNVGIGIGWNNGNPVAPDLAYEMVQGGSASTVVMTQQVTREWNAQFGLMFYASGAGATCYMRHRYFEISPMWVTA
jgi:hypothetical protein